MRRFVWKAKTFGITVLASIKPWWPPGGVASRYAVWLAHGPHPREQQLTQLDHLGQSVAVLGSIALHRLEPVSS
jgi:hypothetical protein